MEEESSPKHRFLTSKNILLLILLLIFINLVYLDLVFLQGSNVKTIEKIISAPLNLQNDPSDCNSDCVDKKISEAMLALKSIVSASPSLTPAPTKAVVQTSSNSSATASREYYVPFGSATQTSTEWQDVSGLSANVDSTNYPNIKTVVFEVSAHIPTGNETVSVRLYNATDGHPVWNSQVDFPGSASSVLKTSQPVSLDSGNKLYKVQIITQLSYPAVIDQSRLHITTK